MYWPTVIIILVKNGAALSLENFTVLYNLNTIYRESIYKEFFTKTIVLSQTKLFINQLDFFLYIILNVYGQSTFHFQRQNIIMVTETSSLIQNKSQIREV